MLAEKKPTGIEKDKAEISINFDFKKLADTPLEQIPPNVVAMFKWSGIYQQLRRGFFMIRVRLPGGLITADQLDALADLADRFAQGQLCLTTRQTFQFHHVRKDDLWRVLEGLAAVGLAIADWLSTVAAPAAPLHARNLRLAPVFHDIVEEARLRGR